ncbi:MAG: NAD(P)-dependent oxidoreductase [Deltaproteobacteria bacterium]|nr:NAD(P)-dependent oxidoreductase [Deltaproteobacteria bacterium]
MTRVLVAGGTGVVGRPLVERLRTAGHEAVTLGRRAGDVRCDALDAAEVARVVAEIRPDVIVHQLTAIPARIRPKRVDEDFAATNRLRVDGTRNLIAAAKAAGVSRFVAQSVAFLCAPSRDASAATERDPIAGAGTGAPALCAALASLERQVAEAGFPQGLVCRYGLFWGPGTVWGDGGAMVQGLGARAIPIVGGGAGRWSMVHVDDAAAGTMKLMLDGVSGVVQLVEDEAPTVAEALTLGARRLGAPAPRRVPRWLARLFAGRYGVFMMCEMRPASNALARSLGWASTRRFLDG